MRLIKAFIMIKSRSCLYKPHKVCKLFFLQKKTNDEIFIFIFFDKTQQATNKNVNITLTSNKHLRLKVLVYQSNPAGSQATLYYTYINYINK